MYDSFYWTYVVRGVSCRAVSVCTIFLYRVVLLRGSFRIVVPSLAMGYGGSLARIHQRYPRLLSPLLPSTLLMKVQRTMGVLLMK